RCFTMLRIHELAAPRPADPGLADLAQLCIELCLAARKLENRDGVVEGVGDQREHGPPVARRAGVGAGRRDGIALAEQRFVDGLGEGMGVIFADLAQSGHGVTPPYSCPRAPWLQ